MCASGVRSPRRREDHGRGPAVVAVAREGRQRDAEERGLLQGANRQSVWNRIESEGVVVMHRGVR